MKVRPLDLLCMTENTAGIFDDIIDDVTLDANMEHLIINCVTSMLSTGKWCSPVY